MAVMNNAITLYPNCGCIVLIIFHLRRTWWTEESIGTASGLWLQTGADDELLLPTVLSRTGGSKC